MFRGVLATAAAMTVLAAVPASADEVTGPIDLGTLPGVLTSSGLAVTNHGIVFGKTLDKAFDVHAARWDAAGRLTDLPPSPGHAYVDPVGINQAGVAIGDSMTNILAGRATLWDSSGVPVELPLLGGFPHYESSGAAAINDHGQAAGFMYGAPGPETAVRWDLTRGTVTALGTGRVRAMNEAGAVIGWYGDETRYWDPAGNLVETAGASVLSAIDDTGTVVGRSGSHAAKWDATGRLTVLDTTWKFSTALAITGDGTIFGEVAAGDGKSWVARWDPAGRLTVLPTPDDAPSRFTAASPSGAVLGQLEAGTPVVWDRAGRVLRLPLPAEGGSCSANGLNDWAVTGSCSAPGRDSHAVLWKLSEPVGNRAR